VPDPSVSDAGEYLSKGSSVYVEGSLKTEKWEDRDGNKKQITKVIGSKLIMLGERKKPVLSEVESGKPQEHRTSQLPDDPPVDRPPKKTPESILKSDKMSLP
jgi:single-strand DNA-binding protein